MGTRGLMGVRINGEDKATYCHSDSYPEGLGVAMVEDLRELGLDRLKELALAARVVNPDSTPSPEDIRHLEPWTNFRVSPQSVEDYYCLTRELQGRLLETLEAGVFLNAAGFINNSLYCEWGYIANLDEGAFEIYKGLQRQPHNAGRYSSVPVMRDSGESYYPCALLMTFPLEDIPEDWIQRLYTQLNKIEVEK
jgi:hypothetical protein